MDWRSRQWLRAMRPAEGAGTGSQETKSRGKEMERLDSRRRGARRIKGRDKGPFGAGSEAGKGQGRAR